jgi:hypothetical protein
VHSERRVGRLRGLELVDIDVVGVLVGDEHRRGPDQRLALGVGAGVDHEHPVAVLEPDAGMAVLG